jgi:hypothetical protein
VRPLTGAIDLVNKIHLWSLFKLSGVEQRLAVRPPTKQRLAVQPTPVVVRPPDI